MKTPTDAEFKRAVEGIKNLGGGTVLAKHGWTEKPKEPTSEDLIEFVRRTYREDTKQRLLALRLEEARRAMDKAWWHLTEGDGEGMQDVAAASEILGEELSK